MPDALDTTTREVLSNFLRDIKNLPNESAKTHRFVALVSQLFPGSEVTTLLTHGIEKTVRVAIGDELRDRRIDAYYGNAVIEFERSLKKSEAVAREQLREQAAGVWRAEQGTGRPLLCIATDCVVWKVFRPVYQGSSPTKPTPDDIELQDLRLLELTEKSLADFWLWLTSLLFRPARVRPTVERFKTDFGMSGLAYTHVMEALQEAWRDARGHSEHQLLFDTWRRYLTVTYGALGGDQKAEEDLELLFLKHTYLASISKLLVWAFLSQGKTERPLRRVVAEVLEGQAFLQYGLANLSEEDFFRWVNAAPHSDTLRHRWERALAQMLTYDLDHFQQDILKGVYQELVDPSDRHDLGEYYTPEWLCERMTVEALPKQGYVTTLDPACGSGSFLRAVVDHFIRANPDDSESDQLDTILDHVVGIDIHPLAVIIAKATYVMALAQLVRHRRRPISIPVYLADSLFMPEEVRQMELGEKPVYEIGFGGQKARIPRRLVRAGPLFDRAVRACARVALDHARTAEESRTTLGAYLQHETPSLTELDDVDEIIDGLWDFTHKLAELIVSGEDSIWSFVVRNAYRPAMFRSHFDLIIGNPPWLSYRYITDPEYQGRVKRLAVKDYGIAPSQKKLHTHMELATLFLVHTLKVFGADGAQLAFVMPRSILSADQHANLRQRQYVAPTRLDSYWDLMGVQPLFKVPACVLFASRHHVHRVQKLTIPALTCRGRLPGKDVSWSQAEPHLAWKHGQADLLYLAARNALVFADPESGKRYRGNKRPSRSSVYSKRFRQGATIIPRNCYFVQIADALQHPQSESLYWAETEPKQAKVSKPPYRDIELHGNVEGQFLFYAALSRNVLPFAVVNLPIVVLPVRMSKSRSTVLEASELRHEGYRNISTWMNTVEEKWNKKRGKKAANMSIYERLDYQKGLSAQTEGQRHLVLYNASGTDICVGRLDREQLSMQFVVDHKLYWLSCRSVAEAQYLTAVLNSEEVNRLIKPFQSVGLQGERDIHKKPLDLPIPYFNENGAAHMKLVQLGAKAERKAARLVSNVDATWSLARQRHHVRKGLSGTLGEIDDAVSALLSSA